VSCEDPFSATGSGVSIFGFWAQTDGLRKKQRMQTKKIFFIFYLSREGKPGRCLLALGGLLSGLPAFQGSGLMDFVPSYSCAAATDLHRFPETVRIRFMFLS
jgi:hypothetical protein